MRAGLVVGVAVTLSAGLGASAGADLLPLPLPLPLPTTTTTTPPATTPPTTTPPVTTPPTTTPVPSTTPTTGPAPSTSTTRPRGTTTTTTSRPARTPAATAAVGSGSSPTSGPSTPPTSRARAAARRRAAAAVGPAGGRPGSPPPTAGSRGDGPTGARALPADQVLALGGTPAAVSGDLFDQLDTMRAPLVLAGAMVLALACAAVLARRRARSVAWARGIEGGALVVDRDQPESALRDELFLLLRSGPATVVGNDCRALQLLVKVAAQEGLEIRDPAGFVVRASRRLVDAKGSVPDRRGLPMRWAVAVEPRSVEVDDGWVMRQTGSADGRLLTFAPGTAMLLWNGDCLR
ncbi:MAG: hypothetical protein ACXV9S_02820 [Acidimicrobiia bacterium]